MLSKKEELIITGAIKEAEEKTSAEIRVFMEERCPSEPLRRAIESFEKLGMTETKERNGVLIYVAIKDRKFAIIGDIGIHRKVGNDFWKKTAQEMKAHFTKGDIVSGIVAGIKQAGDALSTYFPRRDDDINELPDEIIY